MKLKELREAKGLTQSQLAKIAGVSLRMIQYYEQEYKQIDTAAARTVLSIAQALGTTVEELLQ